MRWHNNPGSARFTLHSGDLGRQYERALEEQRTLPRSAPVQNELGHVLAALTHLLAEETEGRP